MLGTAAFADQAFLDEAIATWDPRILVGVDARGGRVSVAGWTKETQSRPEDAIRRLQQRGVTRFAYTSVDRDGMLGGPDLEEVKRISDAVRGRFLYSGGIGSIEDLKALKDLRLREPRRGHLRQGALRGPLHRRRGPGRAGGPLSARRAAATC